MLLLNSNAEGKAFLFPYYSLMCGKSSNYEIILASLCPIPTYPLTVEQMNLMLSVREESGMWSPTASLPRSSGSQFTLGQCVFCSALSHTEKKSGLKEDACKYPGLPMAVQM